MLPEITPLSQWLDVFRLTYLLGGLAGVALLWRRPRPAHLVVMVLGLHLAAWLAYVAPLGRLYGLAERNDRAFNVAMAATVAAGNSPWEHAQVGLASLEPLWDLLVASLALFRPERVVLVYQLMAPLSLVAVATGLYLGLRQRPGDADAWERALIVYSVVGLASISMTHQSPILPFWSGNFLLKPNHACALGVLGVALGVLARRRPWWMLGASLGLLAWAYVVTWVYALIGVVIGTWLLPREERDWRGLSYGLALSLVLALPDLQNLARDYSPLAAGRSPQLVWRGTAPLAKVLAQPYWVTGDLGPLLVLGILGVLVLRARRHRRDALLLGMLAAAGLLWLGAAGAAQADVAFESDELHYYVRFALALCAGAALAVAARHLEEWRGLAAGRGPLLVVAVCWPLTFPAYWNPLRMDRFYASSLEPIGAAEQEYAGWVAAHTPGDAVFLAGPSASTWIGVLSGRRVLLSGDVRPPADYDRRKEVEALLLTTLDPATVRRVARVAGIDFLAIDASLVREYGPPLPRLGESEVYERVYPGPGAEIWKIRAAPDP